MTEEFYLTQRRALLVKALSIDSDKRRFFPRVMAARLRDIARLDAEYTHTDFDACYKALLDDFNMHGDGKGKH